MAKGSKTFWAICEDNEEAPVVFDDSIGCAEIYRTRDLAEARIKEICRLPGFDFPMRVDPVTLKQL
jgi:hypothetical protein